MNQAQLIRYQSKLWPAACAGQSWNPKDKDLRRDIRRDCFEAIGVTSSRADNVALYGEAEITALFVYLAHLSEPNHIGLAQQWENCRSNYRAFNTSRQADHWQGQTYGRSGGHKLTKNRFSGRDKAVSTPFDIDGPLDETEAQNRLVTMRKRAWQKNGRNAVAPRRTVATVEQADWISSPKPPSATAAVGACATTDPFDDEMPF